MLIYIAGGTGYLGQPLIRRLIERGHSVRAVVRKGSECKLPPGVEAVTADPLVAATFRHTIAPADVFVNLIGVAKPAPWKEREFRSVDLPAAKAAVEAASFAYTPHFVYVSVAHPAPVMRAYIAVRKECEAYLAASGLSATVLRPWYVLGPGHWWPYTLVPFYALAARSAAWRDSATRLGLVTHAEMVSALVASVEAQPPKITRILDVPRIRTASIV